MPIVATPPWPHYRCICGETQLPMPALWSSKYAANKCSIQTIIQSLAYSFGCFYHLTSFATTIIRLARRAPAAPPARRAASQGGRRRQSEPASSQPSQRAIKQGSQQPSNSYMATATLMRGQEVMPCSDFSSHLISSHPITALFSVGKCRTFHR